MSRACSADPVAVGIDIVEIAAVRGMLSHGVRSLRRIYTAAEMRGCGPLPPRGASAQRYARVFAAKEAVFKALGRGWGHGMRWREVSVPGGRSGRWTARLRGNAARRMREIGGARVRICASSSRGHAVALAAVYR